MELTKTHRDIVWLLKENPGVPYTSGDIALLCGIDDDTKTRPRTRHMISELRRLGDPELSCIASGADGFFWAADWEDMKATDRGLDSRAMAILAVRAGIRKAYGRDIQLELL